MPMNNINVSVANPAFVRDALQPLHDCGLTVLNMEANNLGGEFNNTLWAPMVNLRVMNLGELQYRHDAAGCSIGMMLLVTAAVIHTAHAAAVIHTTHAAAVIHTAHAAARFARICTHTRAPVPSPPASTPCVSV